MRDECKFADISHYANDVLFFETENKNTAFKAESFLMQAGIIFMAAATTIASTAATASTSLVFLAHQMDDGSRQHRRQYCDDNDIPPVRVKPIHHL